MPLTVWGRRPGSHHALVMEEALLQVRGELLIHCATVQWRGQPLASLQLGSIEGFVVFIASDVAQVVSRRPSTIIPMCNVHLLLERNICQLPHEGHS